MNEGLIQNWNSVVKPNDRVYVLGDIFFCGTKKRQEILDRLNGKIYVVLGNHDSRKELLKHDRFEWVRDVYTLKVEDPDARNGIQKIVCFHNPILSWTGIEQGDWHCFGHLHGSLAPDYSVKRVDVGVDNPLWNHTPVSYAQLKEEMTKYADPVVDHHGRPIDDPYSNMRV